MTSIAAKPGITRSTLTGVLDFARLQSVGLVGFVVVALLVFSAIFADMLAPHHPMDLDLLNMLSPPSAEHWMGTDSFGRDIFSRLIYGGRTALSIGFLSAFLGCGVGAAIGLISAFYGGWTDTLIQRAVDVTLAFPIIVLAMIVVAVLGRAPVLGIDFNVILAIAIPIIPKTTRVIRASALSIRAMPYVDAARVLGYSRARIIFRHMAPNVAAPFLILLTAFIAQAILLEAALSFLGLGVAEPIPSWGLMLAGDAQDFYRQAPWIIIYPGLAISITVFAFNLLGDALRDWMDPKLRE